MIVTLSEQISSIKNDIFWNGNVYSVKCGWASGTVTGIAKKYISMYGGKPRNKSELCTLIAP